MADQNSMEEKSVSQILYNYNLIIPEIQREYVWGYNEYGIIDTLIEDIKNAFVKGDGASRENQEEIRILKKLAENEKYDKKATLQELIQDLELKSKGDDLNIGFLYSYRPNYILDNNSKDVFLIDGQQRFTTLFLLLFYLSIRENRKPEFLELVRFNVKLEQIAFDYRVRNITHDFMIDVISNVNSIEDLKEIEHKNWFLSTYKNDTTIRAIVGISGNFGGAFPLFINCFDEDPNKYFDFVLNRIKFWHFKSEETSQGEELYITMNSRGQQLEDNENIRAKLFESLEAKSAPFKWNEKWENWQDFFWKSRNPLSVKSADKGFNEFLRWVVIIEMILDDEPVEDQNGKPELLGKLYRNRFDKLPTQYINLLNIEKTMDALLVLIRYKEEFDEHLSTIYTEYDRFDLLPINTFLYRANALKQIELFQLLPTLYYIRKRRENNLNIEHLNLFRVLRFFSNRSEDRNLAKSTDIVIGAGIKLIQAIDESGDIISALDNNQGISTTLLNDDEKAKWIKLKESTNRIELEDLFWPAEDYGINKGSISHHIDITNRALQEKIGSDFHQTFKELFKLYRELYENENRIWGDFLPTSMYNIQNNRITCSGLWHLNPIFMHFNLERLKSREINLDTFLINRRKKFIQKYAAPEAMKNEPDVRKQLAIYYIITLCNKKKWVWDEKWNFGVYENSDATGVTNLKSLFASNYIYERYNSQWRYNVGYQSINGLWIQEKSDENRNYFQEVIDWANQN